MGPSPCPCSAKLKDSLDDRRSLRVAEVAAADNAVTVVAFNLDQQAVLDWTAQPDPCLHLPILAAPSRLRLAAGVLMVALPGYRHQHRVR